MKNFVQPGNVLKMIAPSGGVVSGAPYAHGGIAGVAATSAAEDEAYELSTTGVYDLAKTSAQAWTVGVSVYIDDSTGLCTTTSTDNVYLGKATEAAENPSGLGRVKLG